MEDLLNIVKTVPDYITLDKENRLLSITQSLKEVYLKSSERDHYLNLFSFISNFISRRRDKGEPVEEVFKSKSSTGKRYL